MRIYLADPGHNQVTVSSDTYPLGVANLATYVTAYAQTRTPLEVRLFREPQDLKAALDAQLPDVLGVSSYAWNHNLSRCLARYAKAKSPQVLTLMGGPNYPLTRAEQETWQRGMPEIDVCVRGPTYEGERAFLNVIRRFDETGRQLPELFAEPVAGSAWIHPVTGEFVPAEAVERIRDLDEIPSPYLSGWMDPYFATGYFPLLATNRGCPFTCAFCNSSAKSNSKVFAHSVEYMKQDLLYIAERIRPEMPLCLSDDNFGMYEMDIEVADFISWLQDRYGWPRYIRTTTGKNRGERIIEVMRKVRGALPMTSAVQSMNPVVLQNIARQNIKLDTYAEIQKELKAQGMQSYGELILCLPGESKATFIQGVSDLLDTGVKRISAHQLMLLHGAPLANPESREKFGLKTRFRVVARDVGNYTGEPVVELEEMVVETPTFSWDDYLETRVFHLLLTIFYYEGNVEEAFEFAHEFGIKPFHLVVRMQQLLDRAPTGFRRVIDDFLVESQQELFFTREECTAWAVENMDGLIDGSVGGNLLSKYSMLGRFYATHEGLEFLKLTILDMLGDVDDAVGTQLDTVIEYLQLVLLHVPFEQALHHTPEWRTQVDIDRWRSDGYSRPLATYALPAPLLYRMDVDQERATVLRSRVRTFGEHPAGLGKFTRTMFAQQLRRTPTALDSAAEPAEAASAAGRRAVETVLYGAGG